MIIFDLDGTIADCEHRRHYVEDPCDRCNNCYAALKAGFCEVDYQCAWCNHYPARWKQDWKAFYEACDQDKPILPTIELFQSLVYENHIRLAREVQIWSARCESVRDKTQNWLIEHVWGSPSVTLKMRPEGDKTPDEVLKERWLDERINDMGNQAVSDIEFVVDDRPKVVRMWRRRGIFVFNACQHDAEF